ncbi:MAG TPA: ABC transporter ATP-binding protein [Jatrophihabitantaceae bacterium]
MTSIDPTGTARPADPQQPTSALRVRGLRAGYGQSIVLRSVDLDVPPGSVVALLGPNGAGKSTLLKALTGLIRPMAGEIQLGDGRNVAGLAPERIARLGVCLVPEGRGVFPSLTVRENVVLMSRRGDEQGALDRTAELFPELGRRFGQVAGSLSGGEQQMLALARAAISDPGVVLVDEASLGLAPLLVDRVFETFQRIAASGPALLVVEQFVQRALALADHVYLMDRGDIRFSGPAADVDGDEIMRRYLGMSGRG